MNINSYEEMARKYIEGSGGLLDVYYRGASSSHYLPIEIVASTWILVCLTHPANRADLEFLVEQSNLRRMAIASDPT